MVAFSIGFCSFGLIARVAAAADAVASTTSFCGPAAAALIKTAPLSAGTIVSEISYGSQSIAVNCLRSWPFGVVSFFVTIRAPTETLRTMPALISARSGASSSRWLNCRVATALPFSTRAVPGFTTPN